MQWWTFVLVVCLGLGATLAANSHETGQGSSAGAKKTSCPCGTSKKGRIVGGTKALSNEYPWMVSLGIRSWYGGVEHQCGASIVTKRVVITAAHCVHGLPGGTRLVVVAGTSDLTKSGQVVPVTKIIEHENYVQPKDASRTINDIALLELGQDLVFNSNVIPVCMPNSKYNIEGSYVKLIGWGQTGGYDPGVDQLLETDVKVLPFTTCQRQFPLKSPQTQICCQAQRSGACMGDSGGPVTFLDPETNRYTLVGLVSFGSGTCTPTVPTVMTEVSAYLPWIKSKINSLGCQKVSGKRRFHDVVLGG